jgi:PAS domain S-box-containing protein
MRQQEVCIAGTGQARSVLIWLAGLEYELVGTWEWSLQSDTVFCSDVMIHLPASFEGTRSLLHPDDAGLVRERLSDGPGSPVRFLQFRVITSYGAVETITGRDVTVNEASFLTPSLGAEAEVCQEQHKLARRTSDLARQLAATALADRAAGTGTWWLNTTTNDMYYSDGVFHIYGLPPQSLNPHPYTFVPYVHPADREIVTEAFTRAVKAVAPLHLQHRIIRQDGSERLLQQSTWWRHNEAGVLHLYGSMQDITEAAETEQRAVEAVESLRFAQRVQAFTETAVGAATWTFNLLTRKAVYSDAFFRLHGLKPGAITGTPTSFLNYVHPDDRPMVGAVNHKIFQQHVLPEIDYRLVRPDGKVRFVRQRSKILSDGDELVMASVLQDITSEKVSERRLAEFKELAAVQGFTQQHAEELAGMGTWWTDIESGETTWSPQLYQLLGYRTSVGISLRHIRASVHPEDVKRFADHLRLAMDEGQEVTFTFRYLRPAREMTIRAHFKSSVVEDRRIFVAILQDITSQNALQQQLTDRMRLTNALTENLPDAFMITDEINTVVLWNRHCEAAFGLRSEAIVNRNFFDAFPRLKTEAVLQHFNAVLRGTSVSLQAQESVLVRGRWENILMLPLRNEEGSITGILHFMQDVTQQHDMQLHLSERLNFIESLVEASVDRIIVLDRHMNYLYCNGKAAAYYGIAREDILGKNVLEIFPESMNKPTFEHFRSALKGHTVHVPAIEGFTEDHYEQTYLVPIRNEKDEVTAVLWIHHDLSHEIRLRRQLKKSSDILDNIKEAYIELDEDAVLQYVNPQAEALWKRSRANLVGRRLTDVFPVLEGSPLYDSILNAISERRELRGEYMWPALNRWVYISATPYGNGIIMLVSDIDEVKAARDRLRESETMLREAEIVARAGSYEIDIPSMTIRFSDGMYRLLGYEPGAVEPTVDMINDATDPADVPPAMQALTNAIATKEEYSYHRRIRRPDGITCHIVSQGKVLTDETGNVFRLMGTARDVSEMVRTEAELIEAKSFVEQISLITPDLITIHETANNKIVYRNHLHFWEDLLPDDFWNLEAKKRTEALIFEEDEAKAEEFTRKRLLLSGDTQEEVELRLRGGARWIRIRSKVFKRDAEGRTTQVISFTSDITPQKQTLQKLDESRGLLQQTTAATPDAITIYDLQARQPVYLNNCLAEWLGRSSDELIDMGAEGRLELVHPDDRAPLIAFNEAVSGTQDGAVATIEYRLQAATGRHIWIRNRSKVLRRDASGDATHLLSVLQDISAEVGLREKLTERTRYAEAVIDSSIDRMVVLNPAYEVVSWNRQCEEIYGIRRETALGRPFLDLFPKLKEDAFVTSALHRSFAGEKVYLPVRKEIYSNRYSELFYIPIYGQDNEVVLVLNTIHDITKFQEAREELRTMNETLESRNTELEQRNEEATLFTFIASHDLKEPLRKINVFSHWLLERETANLSEKGRDFLERISVAISRMGMLIEDLQGLAQLHHRAAHAEVNLNDVLKEAREELHDLIGETGAVIEAGPLPVLTAVPAQMTYLFHHILHNALTYAHPDVPPVITIAVSLEEEVGPNGRAEFTCLSFTDNGIGFEQKYEKKLFQVFQRLHAREEFEGTGMGLAICKKIMENHGGFIRGESKPGEGAVFSCFFPV